MHIEKQNSYDEEVALALLRHHFLYDEKILKGVDGINAVFERLRCVQQDPLNPCGRNVDLLFHARVRGTHPGLYEKWLYEEHLGIEVYDKELSIVPLSDYPLCIGRVPTQRSKKYNSFMIQHKKDLDLLLKKVKSSGPVQSRDIFDERTVDIFWEKARWAKVALDSLWKNGKLVISARRNGTKIYDIPERVYGPDIKLKRIHELTAEHIMRRLKSVGLLAKSCG